MLTRSLAYIAILPLAVSLPLGCGDDSPSTGGSGAGTASGAGGQGGTGGETATGGLSATGGAGGEAPLHPAAGEPCDVMAQNCADPAAPKCELDFSDPLLLPSTCAESYGDAALDESCERIDNTAGKDTCAPGLFCSFVNVPAGSATGRACRPLCDDMEDCGEEFCSRLNSDVDEPFPPDTRLVGICAPYCDDQFDVTSCMEGTKCLLTNTIFGAPQFSCYTSLGKPEGSPCTSNNDCAPALGCSINEGLCRAFCSPPDHLCPAGLGCQGLLCSPPPATWTCDLAAFADGVTCDCDCGALDPDCGASVGQLPVVGCGAGEKCDAAHCVPEAWTCPGPFYAVADGCDCGCGALDPDCADATVGSCQFCSDVGSCTNQQCPGPIDPNDNSKCQ